MVHMPPLHSTHNCAKPTTSTTLNTPIISPHPSTFPSPLPALAAPNMPFPPKKRRRPYLERQAKRHKWVLPIPPLSTPSSPTTPSSTSQTTHTPPPSPPPAPPTRPLPPFLSLPDDVFNRILSHLHPGPNNPAKIFHCAEHAISLAQTCRTALARYQKFLRVIDIATSTSRDPSAPLLLPEHLPTRIRALVSIAGDSLQVLRLPRYEQSLIGAEAVLPAVQTCKNIRELSFTDCGRVDRRLANRIFAPSLRTIEINTPSARVVQALADSSAQLTSVTLSNVPFSAMKNISTLLSSQSSLTHVVLHFDRRSVRVVEDSAQRSSDSPTTDELRVFLDTLFASWHSTLPNLEHFDCAITDPRELQFMKGGSCAVLGRGLGEVTWMVNTLRRRGGPMPPNLRMMSFCERALRCVPRLVKVGEISVRLPGYDLRYKGLGEVFVRPVLKHLQMTVFLRTLEMTDMWRLTGAIESLNLGDEQMIRLFEEVQGEVTRTIANARDLRRVVVRYPMMEVANARRVMQYVTATLRAAPWVRELELSHEVVLHHEQEEFVDLMQAMSNLEVLHLNAPVENLGSCSKSRMTGFVRNIPKVLKMIAKGCKNLHVLYCERLGEAKVINTTRTRKEITKKLRDIDAMIEGKLSNVDCTSLKALAATWIQQIKHC